MCNETIQPPEKNGTMFLLGAEFVRGRVCQGLSLSGAEMSRNQLGPINTESDPKMAYSYV